MKPHILILPGWNSAKALYSPLVDTFIEEGFRVSVMSFPGFPDCPAPNKPWSLSDYVTFTDTYISTHIKGPYIIIGHSFGGRVALKYASISRPLLQGVVLTGAPGFRPVPWYRYYPVFTLAKLGGVICPEWVRKKIRNAYYYIFHIHDYTRVSGTMKETFKRIVSENVLPYMLGITVPVLLVWGEADRIVPVQIAKKMHRTIKNSELIIIPSARHSVPFSHAKEFVTEIIRFVSEIP